MAITKKFTFKSVLGGHSPTSYVGTQGQFLTSVAIDPEAGNGDAANTSLANRSGGIITPIRYFKFSSSSLNAAPMWLMNNPKNSLTYAYLDNGGLLSYTNVFSSETLVGTPASGAGNGAVYYNNYNYLMTPTDVSRQGPLNDSPSLVDNFWTGLGKSALTNTSYPGTRNITYPNHAGHVHYGKLYFLDFRDGRGRVNFIQTQTGSAEGSDNDGSTEDALVLPLGYYPFDVETYGPDLIIVCSQVTTSGIIRQGKAALFFWDTFSNKPYRQVDLQDSLGTALLTHNGIPHIWSGAIDRAVRLSKYVGGNEIEQLEYLAEGSPPPAGAVDSFGGRIVWGGMSAYPISSGGLFARGYVNPKLPSAALNQVGRITGTGTLPIVSAVKFSQETNANPLMGWRTNEPAEYGLDQVGGSGEFNSIFRTEIGSVGQPFQIRKIRFPLSTLMATGMSVTPTVYVDDETSSTLLDAINPTNDSGQYNALRYCNINGSHNFFIELTFAGTTRLSIGLPIEITVELVTD